VRNSNRIRTGFLGPPCRSIGKNTPIAKQIMEQSATSVIHEIFGMSDGMKVMTIGASTDASNVIPFYIDLGNNDDQT